MSVTTPFITNVSGSPAIPGDFRDIAFSDSGDAYLLTGYYDSTYSNLSYRLYKTTATSINSGSPSLGTKIFDTTAPGFLWATLYQDTTNDLFWFCRGNEIQILQAPLTTTPTTVDTLDPSDLGNSPTDGNLNSVTIYGHRRPSQCVPWRQRPSLRDRSRHTRDSRARSARQRKRSGRNRRHEDVIGRGGRLDGRLRAHPDAAAWRSRSFRSRK